ncbi:MAG: putative lipid II flippase FtsW [Candidatus Magasanikbacteria bacterium]|nr:putative lipid II flippase FtsW [Candidatus Magasanikbacteria bacterium]
MRAHPRPRPDYVFMAGVATWLLFGLVMLTSASTVIGYEKFGDRYFFIKRQLLTGVLPGLLVFWLCARIDYHRWKQFSAIVLAGTLGLLLAVFVPELGSTLNTAARSWLVLGGYSFQPAEAAKLGLIIFLAARLAGQGKDLANFSGGFLPSLGLGSLPLLLILIQPDVGTACILFAILFILLFLAGAKLSHLGGVATVGLGGLAFLILKAPYRAARFMTFLHPELHPLGIGYQINQAFLAIGSGGIFGLGFNRSRQKFHYLPEVHADSIFAIIGEEMGFLVTLGFVGLLVFVTLRALRVARCAPDQFGRLLVSGIAIWFMIQSFLNIGAMVGLLPLTGVPLPFVSHGGTALMVAFAAVGIIVNVSRQAMRTPNVGL